MRSAVYIALSVNKDTKWYFQNESIDMQFAVIPIYYLYCRGSLRGGPDNINLPRLDRRDL